MRIDLMEYKNDKTPERSKFSKHKYPNCTKLLNSSNHSPVLATGAVCANSVFGASLLSTTTSTDLSNLTGSTATVDCDLLIDCRDSSSTSLAKTSDVGQLLMNGLNSATCDAADGLCKLATAVLFSPSSSSVAPENCLPNAADDSFCFFEEQEDLIDGFSFRSFETFALLEECLRREEAKTKPLMPPVADSSTSISGALIKKEKKKAKRNKENRKMNDVDDSKLAASVEEILKSTLQKDLSYCSSPIGDNLRQQHISENAIIESVASTSEATPSNTNGDTGRSLEYLHYNRSSSNHCTNNCERENNPCSNCHVNNIDGAKLLIPAENSVSANSVSITPTYSTAENKTHMAVKHKLDDSKLDSVVPTKVPKIDCENEAISPSKSPLSSVHNNSSIVNGSLVNGTPGLVNHHRNGNVHKSVSSDVRLLSPKQEISSRAETTGSAPTVPETTSGINVPSSSAGLGCLPLNSGNILNGVHQLSSAADLEQRLLIASKGSVFPGLLTPGVSAAGAPPAAYFHTEMHQHQHTHMHQYPPPFLSPFAGSLPVSGGSVFGLPSYQSLSGLQVPQLPPSLANLSTALPNIPLPQQKKKGRWCAMHVQIAWDIHNKTKSRKEGKRSDESSAVPLSTGGDSNGGSHSASTSRQNSIPNNAAVSHHSNNLGHKSRSTSQSIASGHSVIKTEGGNVNSGLPVTVENKTERHRHVEKEKSTNSNHSRSDSRTSVASVKSTSVDKERVSSTHISSEPAASSSAVNDAALQQQKNFSAKTSASSSFVDDGLLYRMQERAQQANSMAAADNLLRTAAALDFRPPFPFAASGLPPFATLGNGQMFSNALTPAGAAAALQSRFNFLNASQFDAAFRMRPAAAPTLDPFRNFADQFGVGRFPFNNSEALSRPPQLDNAMMDNEQRFQGQQQQRQSQTPSNLNNNGIATSIANGSGAIGVNPLASLIDSERASAIRTSSASSMMPGLMPFGAAMPQLDSQAAAAAFYTNLFQQQQQREMEQRNRVLNYNQLAAAAGLSLLPPNSISSLMPGGGFPAAGSPNLDFLRMTGMLGGDPFMSARTFPGFPMPQTSLANFVNHPASLMPPNSLIAGMNNSTLTQVNNNNKLNNNSFSVTLQQMVAARRDSQTNLTSTPHSTLQNR